MKENKYNKYIDLIEYHIGNNIDFVRYKLLPLILGQKILSAIIGAIILIAGTTFIITISENNNRKAQIQLTGDARKIQNTLPVMSDQANKEATTQPLSQNNNINKQSTPSLQTKPSSASPASQKTPLSGASQAIAAPTTAQSKAANNSQLAGSNTQGSGGSGGSQVAQTSKGAQQPSSTPTPTQAAISNNPPQLAFIGPNGQSQDYTPPSTPPVYVTWAQYANDQDHYAIEYPSNWQMVTRNNAGHEQIFIYLPGADPNDPGAQYISFGWSSNFSAPTANYSAPFTLDGVRGTLYTNGAIGSTYIAASYRYTNGFLVLNNNLSSDVFAYIFNNMLLSIDFNPS